MPCPHNVALGPYCHTSGFVTSTVASSPPEKHRTRHLLHDSGMLATSSFRTNIRVRGVALHPSYPDDADSHAPAACLTNGGCFLCGGASNCTNTSWHSSSTYFTFFLDGLYISPLSFALSFLAALLLVVLRWILRQAQLDARPSLHPVSLPVFVSAVALWRRSDRIFAHRFFPRNTLSWDRFTRHTPTAIEAFPPV